MLVLYGRSDCPLCEDAEDVLNRYNIRYHFHDIDEDEELLRKYHTKVPVLSKNEEELFWPFTEERILKLISLKE